MSDTKMTKSAGEHWVCSVLARLGWGAALTRDGLERTDILAVRPGGDRRMVELQVKAAMENARSTSTNWLLNEKAQLRAQSDREWFAFVIIPREIRAVPRTFVAPRDHVVAGTWIFHQHWATDPAVPAGRRNAPRSQARMSVEAWERYEDQWALLNRSVAVAPVLLPERARDLALDPRVGVPPDHPWADRLPEWA